MLWKRKYPDEKIDLDLEIDNIEKYKNRRLV